MIPDNQGEMMSDFDTTDRAKIVLAAADDLVTTIESVMGKLTQVQRAEVMTKLLAFYRARAGV